VLALVQQLHLNPTSTLLDTKKSPGPDRDHVGALLLLLPLLLRPPGLLRPLLPRLVDLDLLLSALLAAEGRVTSAIGKGTKHPSAKPSPRRDLSHKTYRVLHWWCCLPVHEDVSVAGKELPAAEADVEVVVLLVEHVGVVAGVTEHAAGPPRRGRRLQGGGGVAGLEIVVGLHGDGVVVRHCLALCFLCLCSGWEMEVETRGDERQGLLFLRRCDGMEG
jgi:hypothetical protein